VVVLVAGQLNRSAAVLFPGIDRHGVSLRGFLGERGRRSGPLAQTHRAMTRRFQRGLVVGKFSPLYPSLASQSA
jgi:hypothetical protein